MSPLVKIVIAGMGLGRIALGLAPFVAAGPSARLLGFPASHDTATARLIAASIGTDEATGTEASGTEASEPHA